MSEGKVCQFMCHFAPPQSIMTNSSKVRSSLPHPLDKPEPKQTRSHACNAFAPRKRERTRTNTHTHTHTHKHTQTRTRKHDNRQARDKHTQAHNHDTTPHTPTHNRTRRGCPLRGGKQKTKQRSSQRARPSYTSYPSAPANLREILATSK